MSTPTTKGMLMTKKVLLDALHIIKENLQPSQTCESSKYVIFHDGRVCGIDDTIAISVPIFAELSGFAVELQLLYDFVRKLGDKEFLIGLQGGSLKIKGKSTVAAFATRDDMTYSDSLINFDTTKFTKLPEAFGDALSFTGFATDQQEFGYSSCVIYDGAMYALSTCRCARYDMGEEAKQLFPGMTYVTPACTNFVNKMRPSHYMIQDGMIHLYDKDMRIYSARTRTDTNFPVTIADDLLRPAETCVFRFPSGFAEVLDRCNPFSGTDKEVKKVTIRIAEGVLTLQAVRDDGSRCKETILGVASDEPIEFTVNINLLSDMLRVCETYQVEAERLIGTASGYACMAPLSDE